MSPDCGKSQKAGSIESSGARVPYEKQIPKLNLGI